ncbi:MAG: T9SS type A sorting domain-containing protein [Bacteroidetes bacterium]|nr:T9SS type A sorting domain-containing protein [Bacteroidota bacterium]
MENINSITGYRVVPFGSGAIAAPLYIPFSITHKSGDMGNMDISTYNAPGNLPMPPTVSHINNTAGASNAAGTVDRFWVLSKTGANPVADIVYRFTATEKTGIALSAFNQGKAQPWWALGQTRAWVRLTTPYTSATYTQGWGINASPAFDSVRVVNWDWPTLPAQLVAPFFAPSGPIGNSNPWAITANTTPLPVELVNFDAKLVEKRVKLSWTTASEINNDFFTVERADKDVTKFDFIAKVNSYMHNSTVMLNYETWDESPLQGLQYYRLKQTDMDGEFTYSDLKPVYVGSVKSFEITNVYGNSLNNGQFQIEFVYDSELPLSAIITDATGRVIYNQGGIPAVPGINKIQLDQNLSQGIYFIILQNQEKKVSQKFFY